MIQFKPTIYKFQILPFFYETKAFKVVSGLLGLVLIFFVIIYLDHRRRAALILEKNREIEEERTRITQHMHDDIGSTLARLRMRLEMAKSFQAEPDPQLLSDLTSLAQESSKKMRQLIWCSRTDTCSFNDLADYLSNIITEFFQSTPINVQLNIKDSESDIQLGSSAKREWSLILQNLAANVLQHSKADKLQFNLREINGEWIEMMLIDNGIGLPPNAMSKAGSTGLKSIQSRIESQDGQFEIESGSGSNNGVSVIIRMRIANQNSHENKWPWIVRFLLKL